MFCCGWFVTCGICLFLSVAYFIFLLFSISDGSWSSRYQGSWWPCSIRVLVIVNQLSKTAMRLWRILKWRHWGLLLNDVIFFLILYTEMFWLKWNVECDVQKSVSFSCMKDQSSLLKLRFFYASFSHGEWGPGIPLGYLWCSVALLFAEMKAFVNELGFLAVLKMCVN